VVSTVPLRFFGTRSLKEGAATADGATMTTAAVRARLRESASGDAGFSLVETVVAMTLAALVFGAVGGVLVVGLKATLVGRQAQQAADLAHRTMEELRNRDYATLGMDSAEAASDPAITASRYAVPLSNGTTTTEPVVLITASPINPHVTTTTLNNTSFTVARYVTSPPADSITGAAYRRVAVVVSWVTGSRTHSRSTSTLVGLTRRGLPTPASELRVTAPSSVSRGQALVIRVAVTNLGVRSRWTIGTSTTLSSSSTNRLWNFTWYNDDGLTGPCNGVRDSDETSTPLQVGSADTGLLTSEATGCLIGRYMVTGSEQPGAYTLTVTSSVSTAAGVDQTQSASQTRAVQFVVQ
jgi:type II secretory pathway pseudopilin PulG